MWNKIKKITQSSNGSARHLVLIRILPSSLVHLLSPSSLTLSRSLFCFVEFSLVASFSVFLFVLLLFFIPFSRAWLTASSSFGWPSSVPLPIYHHTAHKQTLTKVFLFFVFVEFSVFLVIFQFFAFYFVFFTIFFHFLYRLSHRLFCCITPAWNLGSPSRRGNLVSSLFRTFPISNGYCVAHIFSISSF